MRMANFSVYKCGYVKSIETDRKPLLLREITRSDLNIGHNKYCAFPGRSQLDQGMTQGAGGVASRRRQAAQRRVNPREFFSQNALPC